MLIPQLETQRLILREFRPEDFDAYAEMCGDPDVMRYMGNGQPLSPDDAWRNMALIMGHWPLRGYGMWAVAERQGGELIGRIGFWQPEGWPGFEIGWTLRRSYWGQGLATEGAKAAMDYGFRELPHSHMISLIYPKNIASRRVAEKLGEKLERTAIMSGSQILIYGIHRDDYSPDH